MSLSFPPLPSGLPSPVAGIILGWQEAENPVQLSMRKRRRGRGHGEGRKWRGGDELDNEIDAMRKGCRRPNEMIGDLKEKEDELMTRNCVDSIWREEEETGKPSVASLWCFLSPSGLSFSDAFIWIMFLILFFFHFESWKNNFLNDKMLKTTFNSNCLSHLYSEVNMS